MPEYDGWPENLVLLAFATAAVASFRAARWFIAARRSGGRAGLLPLVAGNLLVFVFLLSVGALCGELAFRFGRDASSSLNVEKASRRWFARHWTKNGAGLRDDVEYSRFAPPGRRRIVFLGDSFAAGQGIDVEDRFANRLRARRPDDDVQVVAGLGWNTANQANTLRNLIEEGYDLELVVLCYCLNDACDGTQGMAELDRLMRDWAPPPPVVRHSYFLDWIYWRVVLALEAPATRGRIQQGYRGAAWERQKQLLSDLRRLVDSAGGRFAVVTFPYFTRGAEYEFRDVHAQLDDYWDELGVPHLDLLPAFETHPPSTMTVNRWDTHPNAEANAIAADAIDDFLDRLGSNASPGTQP